MQQRRLRPGDILDDYCPRERRVTNHVVVAMIEEGVKQTRCSTCDAEHEYKEGRAPVLRRAKVAAAPASPDSVTPSHPAPARSPAPVPQLEGVQDQPVALAADGPAEPASDLIEAPAGHDDGSVHRRLIRATLPRPEGHVPERRPAEFTVRQPGAGGRDDGNRGGRHRGPRAPGHGFADDSRFGGSRHGAGQQGFGGRSGDQAGQRGGRPSGPGRGPRPALGGGRKRGG